MHAFCSILVLTNNALTCSQGSPISFVAFPHFSFLFYLFYFPSVYSFPFILSLPIWSSSLLNYVWLICWLLHMSRPREEEIFQGPTQPPGTGRVAVYQGSDQRPQFSISSTTSPPKCVHVISLTFELETQTSGWQKQAYCERKNPKVWCFTSSIVRGFGTWEGNRQSRAFFQGGWDSAWWNGCRITWASRARWSRQRTTIRVHCVHVRQR